MRFLGQFACLLPGAALVACSVSAATNRPPHWAFQPLASPEPPRVENEKWLKTDLDRFILSQLERLRLPPAPAADKRTLLRRATFDLLGLPPTPGEVAAFERDHSRTSFSNVVERLLASPRYGER